MKKLLAWLLAAAILVSLLMISRRPAAQAQAVSPEQIQAAYRLLQDDLDQGQNNYLEFLDSAQFEMGTSTASAMPQGGAKVEAQGKDGSLLNYRDSVEYVLDLPQSGLYTLSLDYYPLGNTMSDFTVSLSVNGEQAYSELDSITLPLYWASVPGPFPKDSYGDESAPRQERVDAWHNQPLNSKQRSTEQALLVQLKQGENRLTFTNRSNDGLLLGELTALPRGEEIPSYEAYSKAHEGAARGKRQVSINAVNYLHKNDAEAVFASINNPALTPHQSGSKLLNVISWGNDGTELVYEVQVPEDGLYELAFHYANDKPEFDAFHSILLDGELPFLECQSYAFPSTGGNWSNEVLKAKDGTPYHFYLSKGSHTLTLRMEMAPLMPAWHYARLISAHVMRFSLQIKELAGSQMDRNRTWKMTRYLPGIANNLNAYETLIHAIKQETIRYSSKGLDGAMFSELDKALNLIREMKRYPDEIALYTRQMTGADNSIVVSLSRFTTQLTQDNFSLDMIYVTGDGALPPAQAGLMDTVGNWVSTLFQTFTTDKYRQSAGDGKTLTVWVNRALTHVDLLQKLVDTEFTAKTGIKVKLSALTDPGKLTMSASAGTTPDVALGLASHMPFDLASRGALLDLSAFPDFWQFMSQMPAGTMVPYLFNQGVYAVPETLDFACLVYRRDIFDNFGYTVPDTWQDVTAMLPQLQRYGMNFFHNIAQGTGYKWFYQTTPLIYQNGGRLYSQDGYRTAIEQPEAIKGLQALGNLFIAYSLDVQVTSFFDAFRYATQPVGILDSATYILLKNGAPELQGQWALAPYPGTTQDDGGVSRWFIANGQGGIVFKDTKMKEEAWEFLKWWLGKETQVTYSFLLRSTFGDAFLWLPSNLEALKDVPVDRADLDIILESARWLRDVPRTPGQYLLERSISDIWNSMVTQGATAQVAVDEKVILINREIRKKMTELGFYDRDGQAIKPYVVRDIDWIQEQMDKAQGGVP